MGFDNEKKHASACFFSAPCRRGPCDYGSPQKPMAFVLALCMPRLTEASFRRSGIHKAHVSVPLAYEVCWQSEDGTFDKVCQEIIAQGSKIWVNTIWASLCGGIGNDDDAAFISGDPDKVYSRYLDKGVSMIQTDRPELLIGYLTKAGRHTLR
ncbi:MAG: hypothetical protein ACI3ZM_02305 [Candidatus Cryptobacteroides sp.]